MERARVGIRESKLTYMQFRAWQIVYTAYICTQQSCWCTHQRTHLFISSYEFPVGSLQKLHLHYNCFQIKSCRVFEEWVPHCVSAIFNNFKTHRASKWNFLIYLFTFFLSHCIFYFIVKTPIFCSYAYTLKQVLKWSLIYSCLQ